MEAVEVSEGLQGRNGGKDGTRADGLSQQLQSDHRTGLFKHLQGTLFTAAVKVHTIHLRHETTFKLNVKL